MTANRELRGIRKIGYEASIPASGTRFFGSLPIDMVRTATVTTRLTYNASATAGATVNIYYSPDGENWDTVPFITYQPDLTAGSAVQETKILDLPEKGFIRIGVTNSDSSYSITSATIWTSLVRHGDVYVQLDKLVHEEDTIMKYKNTEAKESEA